MPYATPDEVREYSTLDKLDALDDETLEKLIADSEPDVDRATGYSTTQASNGRRFDPLTMEQSDRATLSRATSAQVEYRVVMGAEFFIRDQYTEQSGPEFSTKGTLGRIGPRVYDELGGSNILVLSTSWNGYGEAPSWYSFAYNVESD